MSYRYAPIALVLAILTGLSCAACGQAVSASQRSTSAAPSASASPTARSQRSSAGSRTSSAARRLTAQQRLTAVVAPLIQADGGHVAVAVDDLASGAQASYQGASEFVTASIVKVDILATLLYEAQESGQPLTEEDEDLATTMIENSDNDSASGLFAAIGGASGLDQANQALGLTQTTAGTDGEWGLTTTTVQDQLQLLRLVTTTPSILSASSQAYIRDLMGQVETDQRWGVPAAADTGSQYLVKNGWLPNPTLWSINSIGEIEHDQQTMLVAVLSDGNSSEDSGIDGVQAVAQQAAAAVADG
jgi:beta-lactamase class A